MAKESCPNCATKMIRPVSFCPTCERPTPHATDAERLDWDLRQWRSHVDRSVAAGVVQGSDALRTSGAVMVASPEKPLAPVARVPLMKTKTAPVTEGLAEAHVATRRPKRTKPETKQRDLVIDLDGDDAFAYRACSTCQATDWIVRTQRNEDETWNYWCVRCSRSFKTEFKLAHGVKPFLFSGIVVGGLTAASILILR
jgi:hypothetical protein